MALNHPQNLVSLYRKFYRASFRDRPPFRASARKIVQPLYEANEIICRFNSSCRTEDELIQVIAGHTAKLIDRIHLDPSGVLGCWVLPNDAEERQAILKFAQYLVSEVFYSSFNGDVARFSGKQRGYLEDACEFVYRLADDAERAS